MVSAIIPAYNAAESLADAVDSVLAQTHAPVECIVVNDGSTDATTEVAARYGSAITLVNTDNRGVSAARNRGLEVASGAYVGFLDADDAWAPRKVEALLAELKRHPDAGLAYCPRLVVDQDMRPAGEVRVSPGNLARNALMLEGPVITAIFGLIPMPVLTEIGGFDEGLSTGADVDLTLRIARRWRIVGIDDPLTLYREHRDQMHRNPDLLRDDHLKILPRYLDGPAALAEFVGLRDRAYANLYLMLAIAYQRQHRTRDFWRYLGLAIRSDAGRVAQRLAELVWQRKISARRLASASLRSTPATSRPLHQ